MSYDPHTRAAVVKLEKTIEKSNTKITILTWVLVILTSILVILTAKLVSIKMVWQNCGLVLAGMLIGFGIGVWFALKFRDKKNGK